MSPAGYNNLGYVQFHDSAYFHAVQAFGRACQLAPYHADSWAGLALSLEAIDRPADAAEALRKAIALDPRYAHPQQLVKALLWEPAEADKLQRVIDRVLGREKSQAP